MMQVPYLLSGGRLQLFALVTVTSNSLAGPVCNVGELSAELDSSLTVKENHDMDIILLKNISSL